MMAGIKNICMAMLMAGALTGAAYAVEDCDNDYYWNGSYCTLCPEPTGTWTSACNAGLVEDGDTCDNFIYGISQAGGSVCGFGNNNGENSLTSCRVYSHDQDDERAQCKYCDESGCFVLTQPCYYQS